MFQDIFNMSPNGIVNDSDIEKFAAAEAIHDANSSATGLKDMHVYHGTQIAMSLIAIVFDVFLIGTLRLWPELKHSFKMLITNLALVCVIFSLSFAVKSFLVLYKLENRINCIATSGLAFWSAGTSSSLILILASETYWTSKRVDVDKSIYGFNELYPMYTAAGIAWFLWGGLVTGLFLDLGDSITETCFFSDWYSNRSYVLGCCYFILAQIILVIFMHIATSQQTTYRIYETEDGGPAEDGALGKELKLIICIESIAFAFCMSFLFSWGILIVGLIIHFSVLEVSAAVMLYFILLLNGYAISPIFICIANSSSLRNNIINQCFIKDK